MNLDTYMNHIHRIVHVSIQMLERLTNWNGGSSGEIVAVWGWEATFSFKYGWCKYYVGTLETIKYFFSRYNMDMCEMYYEDGRQNDEKPGEHM